MTDQHDNPIRQTITEAIAQNDVILFMKGTPDAPACGFSARTVGVLQALDTRFAAIDVLPDPRIRQELGRRMCIRPGAVSAAAGGPRLRNRRGGGHLLGFVSGVQPVG